MSATTPPLEQRLLDVVALLEAQLAGARCAVLVGGIDRPDSPWSRSVLHDSGAVLGILERGNDKLAEAKRSPNPDVNKTSKIIYRGNHNI